MGPLRLEASSERELEGSAEACAPTHVPAASGATQQPGGLARNPDFGSIGNTWLAKCDNLYLEWHRLSGEERLSIHAASGSAPGAATAREFPAAPNSAPPSVEVPQVQPRAFVAWESLYASKASSSESESNILVNPSAD